MNRIVLITGATSGIGRACAYRFAAEQDFLILTGRRKSRLDELGSALQAEFNTRVLTLCFDVRNRAEAEHCLSTLPASWEAVDILVNNAGLAVGLNPLQEGETDDWERMIDTNVKGLLYVSRTIVPGMVARRKGHVINIGSIAGKEVYPNGNVYCATKFAVDALTKGLRMDTVKAGIKVTQIAPGAVETEFSMVRFKGDTDCAGGVYKGFVPLSGEDVADAVFYVCSLPDHVNINDLVIMPTAQASATLIDKSL